MSATSKRPSQTNLFCKELLSVNFIQTHNSAMPAMKRR